MSHDRFASRYGVVESDGLQGIGRLFLDRYTGKNEYIEFPRQDHSNVWERDGKAVIFTTQPYGPLTLARLQEMLEFCKQYNLDMKLDSVSFHNPGMTVLIADRHQSDC